MLISKILCLLILILTSNFLKSQSLELKNEFKATKKLFKEKKYYDAFLSNDKALVLSNLEFGEKIWTFSCFDEGQEWLLD